MTGPRILNVTTVYTKLYSGDKPRPHHKLDLALSTLAITLILLAYQEHNKLPKYMTTPTQIIHENMAQVHKPRKPPNYQRLQLRYNHHPPKHEEKDLQTTPSDIPRTHIHATQ